MALHINFNCRGDIPSKLGGLPAGVQNFGSAEIYAPTVWQFEYVRGFGCMEKEAMKHSLREYEAQALRLV